MTVKFRIGIDDAHLTHLDAGRIAEAEGAAAVALHARTAAQRYSGTADWEQIAQLKQQVRTIPVLGNGDIYDASDALAMMASTGCDGVVIGRGLPGPAVAVRRAVGRVHRHPDTDPAHARRGRRHRAPARRACWPRTSAKTRACAISASTSPGTCMVSRRDRSCAGLWRWSRPSTSWTRLLDRLDGTVPFPEAATGPRGRQGSPGRVALPEGWLDDPDDCHGAGRSRRHALGWLNRDALEIASRPISQYDVDLAVLRSGGGGWFTAARALMRL